MQVKDLQPRQGKVDIDLDVVDVGEERQFEKFGKTGRVATAIAKDETGDIKLTLWNDDIDQIKAGAKIKLTNGYVSEWQGEKQLSTGKFGKLEVIGESPEAKEEATSPPNEKENKELYKQSEEQLEKVEEKLEEEPSLDEEEIKDE
jgi:replication factor A1